ncbi:MAG: sensor histidine kinase [Gemmatimonadaceae bacterium]
MIARTHVNQRHSLRTELLISLALLAAAALAIAVSSVLVLYGVLAPERAPVYISLLVAADVCVLVAYAAYQVEKVVLRPLREAMSATEAIAAGDLQRRLPPGETKEMAQLAESVNRMTDRLLEERAHLVRVEKMASIGRLAAGVAHEIGNPLGAINGYLHLLRTSAQAGADARDALAGLEREAVRIDRIVRGLLDFARSKSRMPTAVDLVATARNVVELLTTQGALKHVTVQWRTTEESMLASGDHHDLEQAFVNLLLNAVDAMDGRGTVSIAMIPTTRSELLSGGRRTSDTASTPLNPPSARATHWLESNDALDLVMVVITDSGPGIPAGDAERVFEPFYTTKEPGKGTGLGLAIVARAVENFGGAIWVSSSREGGAAFRMLLPRVQREARSVTPVRRVSSERLEVS